MADIPNNDDFDKQLRRFAEQERELEKYNERMEKSRRQYIAAKNDLKIYEAEQKQFSRKKRNHRIFTRGAMLETFLLKPELLTDEQVHAILKFAFSNSEVNSFLNHTISETIRTLTAPEDKDSEKGNGEC